MLKKLSLAIAAFACVTSVSAENHVGLYFTAAADLNGGSNGQREELNGDGFGVVGKFELQGPVFLMGEYSAANYDTFTETGSADVNADVDVTQARVGIGGALPLHDTAFAAMGYVEAVNLDIDFNNGVDNSETGFGVHTGLVFEPNTAFNIYAQVGYLSIDDSDGTEFKLGVNVNAGERVLLFTDYRSSDLEADDGDVLDFDDFHLGAAFKF